MWCVPFHPLCPQNSDIAGGFARTVARKLPAKSAWPSGLLRFSLRRWCCTLSACRRCSPVPPFWLHLPFSWRLLPLLVWLPPLLLRLSPGRLLLPPFPLRPGRRLLLPGRLLRRLPRRPPRPVWLCPPLRRLRRRLWPLYPLRPVRWLRRCWPCLPSPGRTWRRPGWCPATSRRWLLLRRSWRLRR